MEPSDLRTFLEPVEPTVSLYASVEGDEPSETIVSVALSGLEGPPSWLPRDQVNAAIIAARSVDAAGVAWFGRASGCNSVPLVDPPRHDVAEIGPLPRLLPLIETMHRSVWHAVAVVDRADSLVHIVDFPEDREGSASDAVLTDLDPATIASVILEHVPRHARVLVVGVEADLQTAVVDRLDVALPPSVRVYPADPASDLSEQVVRAVADFSATDLVQALRTFRFLDAHGVVAEGLTSTADALSRGRVTKLFVSPATEDAQLFAGSGAYEISAVDRSGLLTVRASDALLRSAILQGCMVQVIPTHLSDGPAEGVGATLLGE